MANRRTKTGIENEDLIRLVQQRQYLWDCRDPRHKDTGKKNQGWQEIVKILFPEWDSLTPNVQKDLLFALKTRWRSLRDTYTKYVKNQRETKSGSAASKKKPYAFAGYLAFLNPVLELRNTESSWQEEEVMVPADQVEAPAEEEIVGCSPLLQSPMEQSGPEEPFAAEASTAPIQSQSQPRSNRRSQTNRRAPLQEEDDGTGQLISIVSGISQQIEAQRCPHTLFIMSLLPLVQQVPEDRYFAMRMAVQQCIYSFTVPRHPSSLSNHPPPPQNVPNPYPSSFENVRSIYDINTWDIPHPIPSPIPTVISPPVRPQNLTPPMPPTNSEISRNIRPQNLHIVPPSRSRAAKSGNYYTTLPPVSSNNPPAASTIPQMASGEPHIDSQYGTQSRQLTYSNYLSAPLPKYSEVPGQSSNIFKKGAETYYNL